MRSTTHTRQFLRASLLTLAILLMATAVAASAQAHNKDRNHDGISDRWEKAHHLSLKVSQATRDQDHDGVNNRCEAQAALNPHSKDSNHDGVRDGSEDRDHDGLTNSVESSDHTACNSSDSDGDGTPDAAENAGTVVSFTPSSTAPSTGGVLVIKTGTDSIGADVTISGTVTDATRFECFNAQEEEHHGCHGGPTGSTGPAGSTAAISHDGGDSQGEDDNVAGAGCSAADLVPGAVIHEAKLVNGSFEKIEITK